MYWQGMRQECRRIEKRAKTKTVNYIYFSYFKAQILVRLCGGKLKCLKLRDFFVLKKTTFFKSRSKVKRLKIR